MKQMTNKKTENNEIESLIRAISLDSNEKNKNNEKISKWKIAQNKNSIKPLEEWNDKDFIIYFGQAFKKIFGNEYIIKNWGADKITIKELRSSISKSGHNSKVVLKDLIDWCVKNKEMVLKTSLTFLIPDLKKYINIFLSENSSSVDNSVLEINDAEFLNNLKAKLISENMTLVDFLSNYGIPISATYLFNFANKTEEEIISLVFNRMNGLVKAGKIIDVNKIIKKRINMSPYPDDFLILYWREIFDQIITSCESKHESWWRNNDYSGTAPEHYNQIIKNKQKCSTG